MTERLRVLGEQTLAILRQGGYLAASGAWVDIVGAVAAAAAGTRLHLPDERLYATGERNAAPRIEVTNETTLAAARRLGDGAAALVFASGRNPGGGFLSGARAQEEDIARASALYACLTTVRAFYEHHRADRDLRYSDRVVYSPEVPVFRDDTGRLLDRPYRLSMITAAAPNLAAIVRNRPGLAYTVPVVVQRRAVRVLEVASAHGRRRLVLGAWGCGVFGNDPAVVADAFADALQQVAYFDHVVFAVLDRAPGAPTFSAFEERLGDGARAGAAAAGGEP